MSGLNGDDDFDMDGPDIGALDWPCSTIRSAQDTTTTPATFRAVLSEITSPRWASDVAKVRQAYEAGGKDAAAEPKKRLPGVLFSGTFSRRAASALVQHSGLICADLDELGTALEPTFELVASDPHTLACFRSPTGTGLKVVCRVDPTKPHAESFQALEHYMLEHFGLEIDQACKDVSRICFVSHDPEAFVADNATPLPYPPPTKEFTPSGLNPHSGLALTPGDDYDACGDFSALLTTHGWTKCPGGWTRPGKTIGLSATFDKVPGRFYVFSSSVPGFEPNHVYRPWHVYAILNNGGDFVAAARDLGSKGFGQQTRQQQNLNHVAGPAPEIQHPARPLFTLTVPDANDPATILGNRYLSLGDGAVLSSSSGMGKSAMAIQMAARWSLELDCFGIKPSRALRVLYVQSEDSDGDVAEVTASIAHVMALTPQQVAQINTNVLIVTDRTNRGAKFLAQLKLHIAAHKPDLVILNPLQAFIDGDITASQDLGEFLREGLNALNHPASFAYLLIHHTTKPATGKDRSERLWHEVMYDMAGGAELINWARAILSLRATPTEGEFDLVLAKRGRRAGVTRTVGQGVGERVEAVTTVPLKHAHGKLPSGLPIIYWEPRIPDEGTASDFAENKGGRKEKYSFEECADNIPNDPKDAMILERLFRLLKGDVPFKDVQTLYNCLQRWRKKGLVGCKKGAMGQEWYRVVPKQPDKG